MNLSSLNIYRLVLLLSFFYREVEEQDFLSNTMIFYNLNYIMIITGSLLESLVAMKAVVKNYAVYHRFE